MQNYNVVILGAGASGQMAKKFLMDKDIDCIVIEKAKELPFREHTSFFVHEKIDEFITPNEILVQNKISSRNKMSSIRWHQIKYSRKVYGHSFEKVSINDRKQIGYSLNPKLFNDQNVQLGAEIKSINLNEGFITFSEPNGEIFEIRYETLISTIPLPTFLKLASYNYSPIYDLLDEFHFSPIYYWKQKLLFESIISEFEMEITYYPDKKDPFYRSTKYLGEEIFESLTSSKGNKIFWPGKIKDLDDDFKKGIENFIFKSRKKLFFLGRYATWIPKYKLHDTWRNLNEHF